MKRRSRQTDSPSPAQYQTVPVSVSSVRVTGSAPQFAVVAVSAFVEAAAAGTAPYAPGIAVVVPADHLSAPAAAGFAMCGWLSSMVQRLLCKTIKVNEGSHHDLH